MSREKLKSPGRGSWSHGSFLREVQTPSRPHIDLHISLSNLECLFRSLMPHNIEPIAHPSIILIKLANLAAVPMKSHLVLRTGLIVLRDEIILFGLGFRFWLRSVAYGEEILLTVVFGLTSLLCFGLLVACHIGDEGVLCAEFGGGV